MGIKDKTILDNITHTKCSAHRMYDIHIYYLNIVNQTIVVIFDFAQFQKVQRG